MHRHGASRLNFRKGLFLDGSNYDIESLRARRIEHEKGEFAITRNQAQLGFFRRHADSLAFGTAGGEKTRGWRMALLQPQDEGATA